MVNEMESMKYCRHCDEWKSKSEFGKHKGNKDGLLYYCKDCYKELVPKSQNKSLKEDLALLIAGEVIQNVRIERIGAELLLKSCQSRIKDEFPCNWSDRLSFARDLILKKKGFWSEWLVLTDKQDKEINDKEKFNLRPTIDRVIENPEVGYTLDNIQPLALLANILKTQKQKYTVINIGGNTVIKDQKKSEVMEKFLLEKDDVKNVIDSGICVYENELYLIQSNDRTEGMHEQIIPKLVEKSDPIYNGKFILRIPVILKDGDGNIIDDRASIDVPFKYDSRFVSAKVSEIQHT